MRLRFDDKLCSYAAPAQPLPSQPRAVSPDQALSESTEHFTLSHCGVDPSDACCRGDETDNELFWEALDALVDEMCPDTAARLASIDRLASSQTAKRQRLEDELLFTKL